MSHLVSIDDLLDLVSDVKEIDRLTYRVLAHGLVEFRLLCGEALHHEFLMGAEDFAKAQMILSGVLSIETIQ
jgi:hypothetical protein